MQKKLQRRAAPPRAAADWFSRMKSPLTRRQSQSARYILHDSEEVVFMSAAQVAEECGVSDATVVRLAQALGFAGFPEMKQHLRADSFHRLDTVSRLKRTSRRTGSVEELVASVVAQDARNLAETAAHLDRDGIVRAARVLLNAREVGIVGLRSAHALAVMLASTLGFLGKRTRLIVPGTGEMWRDVSGISKDSVVVAISFPHYARLTLEVAETVRRAGATVVSLTDSPFSPLVPVSDLVLTARSRIDSFIESHVTALSLLNALVTAVAYLGGVESIRHLRQMERLWEAKNIYFQSEKRSLPEWAADAKP
jgi:DNA-binding MurR/RpiR family transcriptional regulator